MNLEFDSEKWNKFTSRFNLPYKRFTLPVKLIDAFGFSTRQERTQNGKPFVSIYNFYIKKEEFFSEGQTKPLIITVDYGEIRDNGEVVLSPTSIPRKSNWPVGLFSVNEFFYNDQTGKFYEGNKEIIPIDLLDRVENAHLRPTRPIEGIPFRLKLFLWHTILGNILQMSFFFLRKLLYMCFGLKIKSNNIWSIGITQGITKKEEEQLEVEPFAEKRIKIFEYEASAWAVVFFSVLHLLMYAYWYFFSVKEFIFVKSIFQNPFLTIVYVISAISLYEHFLPKLLWILIKKAGLYFQKASFKQFVLNI